MQTSTVHLPSKPSPSFSTSRGAQPIGNTTRQLVERTVADVFDVDLEELRSATRGVARVALARQVAMYVAHVGCGMRLTDVGHMFGRDRTTVAYACQVIEVRRDDANFSRGVELVEQVVSVMLATRQLGGS